MVTTNVKQCDRCGIDAKDLYDLQRVLLLFGFSLYVDEDSLEYIKDNCWCKSCRDKVSEIERDIRNKMRGPSNGIPP